MQEEKEEEKKNQLKSDFTGVFFQPFLSLPSQPPLFFPFPLARERSSSGA